MFADGARRGVMVVGDAEVERLGLQRGEEALSDGVVPAVALATCVSSNSATASAAGNASSSRASTRGRFDASETLPAHHRT
ncbi:MAG: hypothetical protein INH41_25845 [Myxococcaceae bacterium]|nr:hypothetical protein [Myxococcaceae bacterium]MCA3015825.1 hypothetical protein [Myxococcaceae bacterium]